jgi:hypothetical protein
VPAHPHPRARWTRGNDGHGFIDTNGNVVTFNVPERVSPEEAEMNCPPDAYAHFTITPGGHVDAHTNGRMTMTEFYRLFDQAHPGEIPHWTRQAANPEDMGDDETTGGTTDSNGHQWPTYSLCPICRGEGAYANENTGYPPRTVSIQHEYGPMCHNDHCPSYDWVAHGHKNGKPSWAIKRDADPLKRQWEESPSYSGEEDPLWNEFWRGANAHDPACPKCGATDEWNGDLCDSCGHGSDPCPRCGQERHGFDGHCYQCNMSVPSEVSAPGKTQCQNCGSTDLSPRDYPQPIYQCRDCASYTRIPNDGLHVDKVKLPVYSLPELGPIRQGGWESVMPGPNWDEFPEPKALKPMVCPNCHLGMTPHLGLCPLCGHEVYASGEDVPPSHFSAVPALELVYLPANMAWTFLEFGSPTAIAMGKRFYENRDEAVTDALRLGLAVRSDGSVSSIKGDGAESEDIIEDSPEAWGDNITYLPGVPKRTGGWEHVEVKLLHHHPLTGAPCDCPYGKPKFHCFDHRVSGINWNRILKNEKFQAIPGSQQFVDYMNNLFNSDTHGYYDEISPFLVRQFRQGNLKMQPMRDGDQEKLVPHYPARWEQVRNPQFIDRRNTPDVDQYLMREDGTYQMEPKYEPLLHGPHSALHSWGQWAAARQHPSRRGVNINDPKFSFEELHPRVREHQTWLAEQAKRERNRQAMMNSQAPVVYEFTKNGKSSGWTIRDLAQADDPASEMELEGEIMNHCIGNDDDYPHNGYSYKHAVGDGKIDHVYSLRDPEGIPHVTAHTNAPDEYRSGTLAEMHGYNNQAGGLNKYAPYMAHFFRERHPEFLDSDADSYSAEDMRNGQHPWTTHGNTWEPENQYAHSYMVEPATDMTDLRYDYLGDGEMYDSRVPNEYHEAINAGHDPDLETSEPDYPSVARDAVDEWDSTDPYNNDAHRTMKELYNHFNGGPVYTNLVRAIREHGGEGEALADHLNRCERMDDWDGAFAMQGPDTIPQYLMHHDKGNPHYENWPAGSWEDRAPRYDPDRWGNQPWEDLTVESPMWENIVDDLVHSYHLDPETAKHVIGVAKRNGHLDDLERAIHERQNLYDNSERHYLRGNLQGLKDAISEKRFPPSSGPLQPLFEDVTNPWQHAEEENDYRYPVTHPELDHTPEQYPRYLNPARKEVQLEQSQERANNDQVCPRCAAPRTPTGFCPICNDQTRPPFNPATGDCERCNNGDRGAGHPCNRCGLNYAQWQRALEGRQQNSLQGQLGEPRPAGGPPHQANIRSGDYDSPPQGFGDPDTSRHDTGVSGWQPDRDEEVAPHALELMQWLKGRSKMPKSVNPLPDPTQDTGTSSPDPLPGALSLSKVMPEGMTQNAQRNAQKGSEYDPATNAQIACPACKNRWPDVKNCWTCKGVGYFEHPRTTDGYRTPDMGPWNLYEGIEGVDTGRQPGEPYPNSPKWSAYTSPWSLDPEYQRKSELDEWRLRTLPRMSDEELAVAVHERNDPQFVTAVQIERALRQQRNSGLFDALKPITVPPYQMPEGTACRFHPDRPAVNAEGFAPMCEDCDVRYQQAKERVERGEHFSAAFDAPSNPDTPKPLPPMTTNPTHPFTPANPLQKLWLEIGEAIEAGDIDQARILYRQLPPSMRPAHFARILSSIPLTAGEDDWIAENWVDQTVQMPPEPGEQEAQPQQPQYEEVKNG